MIIPNFPTDGGFFLANYAPPKNSPRKIRFADEEGLPIEMGPSPSPSSSPETVRTSPEMVPSLDSPRPFCNKVAPEPTIPLVEPQSTWWCC